MEDKKYDTLVLAGGGVKGFTILGALQAIYDKNLIDDIKTYIGTSIGAIICYLVAIGYTPVEIIVSVYGNRWLEKMKHFNLVALINGNGATSFTSLHESLEKLTINKIGKLLTLAKLKEEFGKTLICTTYNATLCKTEYLGPDNYPDLPCLTALRMSGNLPLIFDRFKYMDNFYLDGGISDNFSIAKGVEIGTNVIGVYLEVDEQTLRDEPEDGMINYFFRLLQIPILQATRYKVDLVKNQCVVIPIRGKKLGNTMSFDINSKDRLDMFSAGYNEVRDFLK